MTPAKSDLELGGGSAEADQGHLVKEHRGGDYTTADLAELFSVHRATVYRVLQRSQDMNTEV